MNHKYNPNTRTMLAEHSKWRSKKVGIHYLNIKMSVVLFCVKKMCVEKKERAI